MFCVFLDRRSSSSLPSGLEMRGQDGSAVWGLFVKAWAEYPYSATLTALLAGVGILKSF